jgi:hypothetical protein
MPAPVIPHRDTIVAFQAEACARVEHARAQLEAHGFDPGESVADWLASLRAAQRPMTTTAA